MRILLDEILDSVFSVIPFACLGLEKSVDLINACHFIRVEAKIGPMLIGQ